MRVSRALSAELSVILILSVIANNALATLYKSAHSVKGSCRECIEAFARGAAALNILGFRRELSKEWGNIVIFVFASFIYSALSTRSMFMLSCVVFCCHTALSFLTSDAPSGIMLMPTVPWSKIGNVPFTVSFTVALTSTPLKDDAWNNCQRVMKCSQSAKYDQKSINV